MILNNDYFDFPVYKIPDSQEGILVKSNKFPQSYLTVLILDEENSLENLDFLKKIISALGISWDSDCRIRTFSNNVQINLAGIINSDKSKYIIGFGIDKKDFAIQAELLVKKWNRFNSFRLLLSLQLTKLKNDTTQKRILWNELQKEFNGK